MKTLKGLLITILVLGMSTGFSANSYADKEEMQIISYDELDKETQAEFEVLVNDYCKVLDEYKDDKKVSRYLQGTSGYVAVASFGAASIPVVWTVATYTAIQLSPVQRDTSRKITKAIKALWNPSVMKVVDGTGARMFKLIGTGLVALASWGSIKAYNSFSSEKKELEEKEKMTAQEMKTTLDEYNVESVSYKKLKESLESFCDNNLRKKLVIKNENL